MTKTTSDKISNAYNLGVQAAEIYGANRPGWACVGDWRVLWNAYPKPSKRMENAFLDGFLHA